MSEITRTDVNQIRISSLGDIQGQPQVQALLQVNLDAYHVQKKRSPQSVCFGPVLLVGPPGTGKSLTAKVIHQELKNQTFIETNGEMLNNTAELNNILLTADDNSTILIDECQALSAKAQHILLTAISERMLYASSKKGNNTTMTIPLANFSLILASTHEFQLQDALRNRIRIYCRFDYYSINDLITIVKYRILELGWKYESKKVLRLIAQRSKNTPRLAINRNLQMSFNVASSRGSDIITVNNALKAFELLQIDELGLDRLEREYLKVLSEHQRMQLNVLAAKMGLPRQTVATVIEPYLLQQNLISKENGQRIISAQGIKHIKNSTIN